MSLLIFRYFLDSHSPYFFLKNGLQLLKKKALEMIPKSVNMEELKHKASLRVAERIIIFEIASHFN